MTKRYHAILTGTIEVLTPLATSPPDDGAGKGPARLPRMPIFLADEVHSVPYFPGSGFRGKLRRAAFDCAIAAAPGAFPMELRDYLYNVLGGVKGDEKEDKGTIESAAMRRSRNPLVSLFGAAVPWTAARLGVGHAIPPGPMEIATIGGVRTDDLARQPDRLALLTDAGRSDYLGFARANQARVVAERELERLERDEKAARKAGDGPIAGELAAKVAAKTEDLADFRSRMAVVSSNSIGMPIAGYEAIPVGARLSHRMTLRNASIVELGLFADALLAFARDPILGAHAAHGCGAVRGEYAVRTIVDGVEDRAEIVLDPAEDVDLPGPFAAAREAWLAAASGCDFRGEDAR